MLVKENTGLILIDVQGKLARLVADSDAVIGNCSKLIRGVQALGLPIVWLEQNPDKLGATVDELRLLFDRQQPLTKYTFGACDTPAFQQAIEHEGKTSWLVCGIEAHICVYQTVSQLAALGYDMHLVADCISARDPANKALAIQKMLSAGVALTGVEMCLYELVQDCRAPAFKTVLALIR